MRPARTRGSVSWAFSRQERARVDGVDARPDAKWHRTAVRRIDLMRAQPVIDALEESLCLALEKGSKGGKLPRIDPEVLRAAFETGGIGGASGQVVLDRRREVR